MSCAAGMPIGYTDIRSVLDLLKDETQVFDLLNLEETVLDRVFLYVGHHLHYILGRGVAGEAR